MSQKFALGGIFLNTLAAKGVADGDLERIERRGLSDKVAKAIRQIIDDDLKKEQGEFARRMHVENTSVERLAEMSGVHYDYLDHPYEGMVAKLRENKIVRIGQLTKVTRDDLYRFGLHVQQALYVSVALEAIGLRLK